MYRHKCDSRIEIVRNTDLTLKWHTIIVSRHLSRGIVIEV